MSTIENALVLAAGRGTRLREGGDDQPKPLHRIHGRTLAERTISTLAAAGVKRFVIVVGHEAERVETAIRQDPRLADRGLELQFTLTWSSDKSNGASILPARELLDGPFLLSMCDHVYDVSLAEKVAAADMSASDLYLCVDRRLDEIYDMDDATKVQADDNDVIVAINKQLTDYNCIDCGVFAAGTALLDELQAVWDATGDASLSAGVLKLGERGRAKVLDIGAAFWQDVDTPGALARAESILEA